LGSDPVLSARFERRSDLVAIARAALDVDIVYVALASAPGAGRHTLQLFVGDDLVTRVSAELVGSGRDGEYPLRMRVLDGEARAELEALAERAIKPSTAGPLPRRTSLAVPREPEPLIGASEAHSEDSTLASRADSSPGGLSRDQSGDRSNEREVAASRPSPVPAPRQTPTPAAPEEGLVETSFFSPDDLLRAPVAPNTGSEDVTLPLSASSPKVKKVSVRRPDYETEFGDESGTLPGDSAPKDGSETIVSWNVRIAPTTKDPLCGRSISGGKYTLDSVIGTGAIGIVFKASHRDLGRTVAIKVLNPQYRDDPDLLNIFRTEARAASQLEHPNVARVYDYGQEPDGLVYIVMEYLSGYTLGSVLAARKRLAVPRALELMIQICAGLTAAHERGIVHRDVKPDNIVLVPEQDDEGQPVEVVKVCDFGIAALATKAPKEGGGQAAGTPEYMAPEQQMGGAVTAAADVYACGVVLYEMLAGEVPFTDPQAYRILLKHQNEVPRPPSTLANDIDPALEAIVLRCLEKQPAKRYQSARELRAELRRVSR
jgi:tRNA A-37 threonylcarbamoyl transferase component Bud32